MARTLRQSWLDEMGRAERAEAQLQQAQERADENCRLYEALREETGKAITAAEQAIERAKAAEGLLEAAWLQSGHPHFQTWYENLTPAQRGEGDADAESS